MTIITSSESNFLIYEQIENFGYENLLNLEIGGDTKHKSYPQLEGNLKKPNHIISLTLQTYLPFFPKKQNKTIQEQLS